MKAVYKITDIIRLGLHSLVVHKFRSFLTALGILFGVWSVIAMLAINEGASYESQQALRQMGTDNLIVESVKPPPEQTTAARERGALSYGLTRDDVRCLRDNIPGVIRSVTAHRTFKSAQRGSKLIPVQVLGTAPPYYELARLRLAEGRFLTEPDRLRRRNCCVMTRSLARRLFGYEDPLGQAVRLDGRTFVVVGLVEKPSRSAAAVPAELAANLVFIPDTTDAMRFGKYTIVRTGSSSLKELVQVSQVILQMADERAVLEGARVARSLLARRHDALDYEITVPLELIEQRRRQRRLWNIVFFFIASVSLIVGGIGIMNVMLASVQERVREIGIRRALGAKRRDIVVQFLVESVMLTTVGGLMGIAVGAFVPAIVERVLTLKTIISVPTVLVPFIMAVVVGVISGFYPALRAARLDPIAALRHE